MTNPAALLTLDEYHRRFAHEHGAEFWFGAVRYKSVPTWLHSILQIIIGDILSRMGYPAGSELDMRVDPHWEPKPDVLAARRVQGAYPAEANEIALVVEIRSPDDSLKDILEKCYHYARVGVAHVYVFDPAAETAFAWDAGTNRLNRIHDTWTLPDGEEIALTPIWDELRRRVAMRKPQS